MYYLFYFVLYCIICIFCIFCINFESSQLIFGLFIVLYVGDFCVFFKQFSFVKYRLYLMRFTFLYILFYVNLLLCVMLVVVASLRQLLGSIYCLFYGRYYLFLFIIYYIMAVIMLFLYSVCFKSLRQVVVIKFDVFVLNFCFSLLFLIGKGD